MKLTVNGSPITLDKFKPNSIKRVGIRRVPCTPDGVPLARGHVMLDGTVVRGTSRLSAPREVKPALRDITLKRIDPEALLWLEVESVYQTEFKPEGLSMALFRYQSSPHDSGIVFFPDGFAVVGKPLEVE